VVAVVAEFSGREYRCGIDRTWGDRGGCGETVGPLPTHPCPVALLGPIGIWSSCGDVEKRVGGATRRGMGWGVGAPRANHQTNKGLHRKPALRGKKNPSQRAIGGWGGAASGRTYLALRDKHSSLEAAQDERLPGTTVLPRGIEPRSMNPPAGVSAWPVSSRRCHDKILNCDDSEAHAHWW